MSSVQKKKRYAELPVLREFIEELPSDERNEYLFIVQKLEINGRLSMPYGEKITDKLFAIRVIQTANIRVFYVYGEEDKIYGLYGYRKKTEKIPDREMKRARKILSCLRQAGMIR